MAAMYGSKVNSFINMGKNMHGFKLTLQVRVQIWAVTGTDAIICVLASLSQVPQIASKNANKLISFV